MDDLDVLARDFSYRSRGKSNPMRSDSGDRRSCFAQSSSSALFHDDHSNRDGLLFNDIFDGPSRYSNTSNNANKSTNSLMCDFDYDSYFLNPPQVIIFVIIIQRLRRFQFMTSRV
ncbi:hypothetical protein ACH5RR_035482 [Cinchona calisaya]|uniref:Uncharacterized protein n=1 Tax=Cinchona calisaya TaxID=153742 RepID=A0ABD2Y5W2_9GENT